jgi:hypothetical protein
MFAEHAQVGLHGPTLLSFRNTASGIRERTQNYLKGLPPTSTGRFQGRGPRREAGCKGEEPRLNIAKYLSLPEPEKVAAPLPGNRDRGADLEQGGKADGGGAVVTARRSPIRGRDRARSGCARSDPTSMLRSAPVFRTVESSSNCWSCAPNEFPVGTLRSGVRVVSTGSPHPVRLNGDLGIEPAVPKRLAENEQEDCAVSARHSARTERPCDV